MLLPAVVLNPVPVIVTVVPMGPEVGENELIVGCANAEDGPINNKSKKQNSAFLNVFEDECLAEFECLGTVDCIG